MEIARTRPTSAWADQGQILYLALAKESQEVMIKYISSCDNNIQNTLILSY